MTSYEGDVCGAQPYKEDRGKQTGRDQVTSKHLGFSRTQTEPWLTFGWSHQQVDCLLLQVGPDSVYLPLQVSIAQMLRQDPWGCTCHIRSAPQLFALTSEPSVRPQGTLDFVVFSLSPDASLISRAVRIKAISVEVKCTVLSSAMGMFIFTSRWEEGEQRGGAMNQELTTVRERRLDKRWNYESN